MRRVADKLRAEKPALGILMKGGEQLVDFIAQAEFDFIIPDMMFSKLDWNELNHMIRAAHAGGIDCFPRVQAYPWASLQPDRRLAVDSARALSIGADGVCMSVSGAEEVRQVVTITGDWHRGVAISSGDEVKQHEARVHARTLVLPLIESKTAIDEIDEILAVPGLTGIFIAWTDFTKQLGLDFQYEHPDVLALVSRIIKGAQERNLVVMANTGYIFQDIEANAQRIKRMAALGVQMIMVQTTEFLVYTTLRDTVARVGALGAAVGAPAMR